MVHVTREEIPCGITENPVFFNAPRWIPDIYVPTAVVITTDRPMRWKPITEIQLVSGLNTPGLHGRDTGRQRSGPNQLPSSSVYSPELIFANRRLHT